MLVFGAIAAFGVLLLLSMLIVGELFGGDHEISHDVAVGHEVDLGGPSIFSTRIIAAFLTAFGVGGVIGRYYQFSYPISSGIGVVCGALMSSLVYQFAKILYSQQASSELQMTGLVGKTAEVSVAIPADGVGQVVVSMRGERSEHIARAAGGRAVARGTAVTITAIRGDSVTVAPPGAAETGGMV